MNQNQNNEVDHLSDFFERDRDPSDSDQFESEAEGNTDSDATQVIDSDSEESDNNDNGNGNGEESDQQQTNRPAGPAQAHAQAQGTTSTHGGDRGNKRSAPDPDPSTSSDEESDIRRIPRTLGFRLRGSNGAQAAAAQTMQPPLPPPASARPALARASTGASPRMATRMRTNQQNGGAVASGARDGNGSGSIRDDDANLTMCQSCYAYVHSFHARRHKGIDNFECPTCSLRCLTGELCLYHELRVHGNGMAPLDFPPIVPSSSTGFSPARGYPEVLSRLRHDQALMLSNTQYNLAKRPRVLRLDCDTCARENSLGLPPFN